MSRTGPATCARSCGSLVQLTYPWPVYTKDTTRFRSWPDMAMVNCRRSRREWLRAAYRLWGADDAKGLHIIRGEKPVLQGRKILASCADFVTDPIVTAKAGDGQVMCSLQLAMDEKIDLSAWSARNAHDGEGCHRSLRHCRNRREHGRHGG